MDFRERFGDHQEMLRAVLDGRQVQMWTALPGQITKVNLKEITVEVQPTIQAVVVGSTGNRKYVTLPLLQDVPIVYPRGGKYTMTFPVQAGDECLVVFSSRCIDNWWKNGGVQQPYEHRLHDLSDGFALVGPFSQANVIQNISTTTAQFRTNDGKMFFELDAQNNKARAITPSCTLQLDEGAQTITGSVGGSTITVTANGVTINTSGNVTVSGQGGVSISSGAGVTIAGTSINLNSANIHSSTKINTP